MTTSLNTRAKEKGTYTVVVSFTDEDGSAVTPNNLQWSLKDLQGNFINYRSGETLVPGTSVNITLSGLDLALPSGSDEPSVVVVLEGDYDSSYGSGLPISDSVIITIDDVFGV